MDHGLFVNLKTIKLLKYNLGGNIGNLQYNNNFLDTIPKV